MFLRHILRSFHVQKKMPFLVPLNNAIRNVINRISRKSIKSLSSLTVARSLLVLHSLRLQFIYSRSECEHRTVGLLRQENTHYEWDALFEYNGLSWLRIIYTNTRACPYVLCMYTAHFHMIYGTRFLSFSCWKQNKTIRNEVQNRCGTHDYR